MVKNLKKQKEAQMRVAVIDYDSCQPDKCNYLCERVCPVNRQGKNCIVTDEETQKPIISEELCTACGICPHKCPFKAISIINLSAALGNPVHQYGKNSFRLYRLPLPKESSIVGIIGRNATGKTTALEILSGELIPNLGNYGSPTESYKKVIETLRGTELQNFFEKINTKGIKISHKPQQIDALPKIAKGKVSELLKSVDQRKAYSQVTKDLHIEPLLNRTLDKLSGGELQRTAIAAAVLKDADLYTIDEPTTHLDISERLNTAKVLRELADNQKSVIVIEHDLAVLDYLSDYIHILFGKQATYGVVSSPKSTLNGINEFLEGFIKDENLKFRQNVIHFASKPPEETVKRTVVATYPALEKRFENFSLKTEGGTLREGEVIGILGPNATGKTTFVKMLAGVETPDNTNLDLKLKVSYKPQYIIPEDLTVKELFAKNKINQGLFKNEIDRRLNTSNLFEKNLQSLSGGELQKTAVSLALAQECDLYLLDEPSAFVDVEDRLNLADTIRAVTDKTSRVAIVVDHDIVFQDYVSNRLMVFSGIPSKEGKAAAPAEMADGMNSFLESLGITYRRDHTTGRPRANKPNSVKDQEQKKSRNYYYT